MIQLYDRYDCLSKKTTMAADQTTAELTTALKKIQELRASVAQVFGHLSEGVKDTKRAKDADKQFLSHLQQNLVAVNKDFRYYRSNKVK